MHAEPCAGSHRRPLISVIGGRAQNVADDDVLILAEQVGRELAHRGLGIVTGGDDGVAAAANRGCFQAGGTTIAVTKGQDRGCGDYVTYVIPTAMDLSRSAPLLWAGDAILAFSGRFGTLFELALALDAERPVVAVGHPRFVDSDLLDAPGLRVLDDTSELNAVDIVDTLVGLIDRSRTDV